MLVVQQALDGRINDIYLWSDSTIVLSWLKTPTYRLKTFIANSTAEIQTLTASAKWQHVNSADNPADVISRGLTAEELTKNKLWWTGPEWLNTRHWPEQTYTIHDPLPEEKLAQTTLVAYQDSMDIIHRYSSIIKLQRVIGYCLRFVNACKKNTMKFEKELSVQELNRSLETIIKLVQQQAFPHEISDLQGGRSVSNRSRLLSLHPFLDDHGLIRVGGRLHHSDIPEDQKHPLILPKAHHITNLVLENEHVRLQHCGQGQLLAMIRLKYWPIAGRLAVRRIIRKCYKCFRVNPRSETPNMGNLLKPRVCGSTRPFKICGVDYAGPIHIRESRRRGRVHITKAYVAIFICFSTKAIHIELVSDLTADAFIAALRRFVARRGLCAEIYSDNGTNFVGANRKLKDIQEILEQNQEKIARELADRHITWNFIPPRAPHFGGLWEAAVKSTKTHLIKVTQNIIFTFEKCYTLLTEIEAVLNSRPITTLSSNPDDLTPLTPSHFLIGESLLEPVSIDHKEISTNLLSRWQHLTKIKQHFWQRWYREYLHQLQTRSRWQTGTSNIEVGTMVVLNEDNIPPLRWRIGRVTRTYPGEDGVVRVVLVRSASGEVKRPERKLCVLPNNNEI